jgi:hypothetical protein
MTPTALLFVVLSFCAVAAWLIVRRMIAAVVEEYQGEVGRQAFRRERERLEFRFLQALERANPEERVRWDDAHWKDEVYWARDRGTRRLLALVGVDLPPSTAADLGRGTTVTALFEFRRGRWMADGRFVETAAPADACRHAKLEAVSPPADELDVD